MTDKTEWVMVPRRMTSDMVDAMYSGWCDEDNANDANLHRAWSLVLTAAPAPPAQEAQPVAWMRKCEPGTGYMFAYGPFGAKERGANWEPLYAIPPDAARRIRELEAERDRLQREQDEDQGVIRVWRGRTGRAEAERDRLREALKMICTAEGDQCDNGYSPQYVARAALGRES